MKFAKVTALGALIACVVRPVMSAPASQTITGKITAVTGVMLTVHTPDSGPGMSHGPGIHSFAIVAGRTFHVNVNHAAWRKMDYSPISRPALAVGSQVTIYATPGQNGTYNATSVLVPK